MPTGSMPRRDGLPAKRSRSPSTDAQAVGATTASPKARPVYGIKASPLLMPKRQNSSSPRLMALSGPVSPLTSSVFTCPEISFHVEAARSSNTLNPRDIANLILWAVPTTVPLVESPKWFFLKSRSHVRGVLTIYCNGISYDTMMNTGCGLAAATSEAAWHDEVGERALLPVRRGCCFARNNDVCHTPIWVPSQNNRLELDLFLRTQSHRRNAPARRSLLEVAKEVASSSSSSIEPAEVGQQAPPCRPPPAADEGCVANFLDVENLMQFALTMDANVAQLCELRFILEPPASDAARWRRFNTPSLPSTTVPKVYAFDCEMVLVSDNVSALARCTLVALPSETVVLDMLIKPDEPIVDYVTRFSGITEEMLSTVTMSLPDAQDQLMKWIDTETLS